MTTLKERRKELLRVATTALEAAAHTALTWEEESTDGSWSFCYVPPTAGEGAP